MKGRLASGAWAVMAVIAPLAILWAIDWSAEGRSAWIVLHACARAIATAISVPVALAIALAASIWGLLLWHTCRQALTSRHAIRLARRHAVAPPCSVAAASRRLGIRRLVVTDLPERLAYCAGLLRPTVVVSAALIRSLDPVPLEAVLAHEAAHARNRDPLRQVLAHAVARALWIAPAARCAAEHRCLRLELAADGRARAHAGPRALAEALLALHSTPWPPAVPAIAGGGTALGARIDALVLGAPPPRLVIEASCFRRSAAGLALVGLLILAVTVAPRAGSDAILKMPMNVVNIADMALAWGLRGILIALGWMTAGRWFRALRCHTPKGAR